MEWPTSKEAWKTHTWPQNKKNMMMMMKRRLIEFEVRGCPAASQTRWHLGTFPLLELRATHAFRRFLAAATFQAKKRYLRLSSMDKFPQLPLKPYSWPYSVCGLLPFCVDLGLLLSCSSMLHCASRA